MSAYLVSKRHIDCLVEAAVTYGRKEGLTWSDGQRRKHLEGTTLWHLEPLKQTQIGTAHDVGAMLWAENLQSVASRYPEDHDGQRPGPVDLSDADILAYQYQPVHGLFLTPVMLLKALACYEYQSCEHDEWKRSEAKDFCDSLRVCLICQLPGYKEAPWEIDEETTAPLGARR